MEPTGSLGTTRHVILAALAAGALGMMAALGAIAGGQRLTPELRQEYVANWKRMALRPAQLRYIDSRIDRLAKYQDAYFAVGRATDVPWFVVGVIDELEAGGGACRHLHNGDSLKHRTVNVPAGRPTDGDPPFTWYVSAIDALRYDNLDEWTDWSVAGILYQLECYNGWGYRRKQINTPYLWAGSTVYGPPEAKGGKFVKDGVFSSTAVSSQIGAAVLLRRMVDRHLIIITGREVKS